MAEIHFQTPPQPFSKAGDHGILLGWGAVSTENGKPVVDRQGDYIPDSALLNAVAKFHKAGPTILRQHQGEPVGELVFSFPFTAEIAKSLGIPPTKTGWLIGVRANDEILKAFDEGEVSGFSIGGMLTKHKSLNKEPVQKNLKKAKSTGIGLGVLGGKKFDKALGIVRRSHAAVKQPLSNLTGIGNVNRRVKILHDLVAPRNIRPPDLTEWKRYHAEGEAMIMSFASKSVAAHIASPAGRVMTETQLADLARFRDGLHKHLGLLSAWIKINPTLKGTQQYQLIEQAFQEGRRLQNRLKKVMHRYRRTVGVLSQ